ncbi:hypothetical protein [Burkholderia sp. WSM2232]|uniref:hypothetical protein n=1 Tax=Burkholderia sp. WSM2232 TaxID=944436 RepID=UPI0003FE5422|nr:hypothetical protein [Burkholderia sp. WSM2232]
MPQLALPEICRRISLHPPYFAFLDLHDHDTRGVHGTFRAEHQTGYELGPVCAGELIRHLATLGSCAAVLDETSTPTYYLGTKGRLKVVRNASPDDPQGEFHARSEVLFQDRKSLVAHSTVARGQYLAHFHCEYQALPAPVFARTFRHYHASPSSISSDSPYREPIELDFGMPNDDVLIAHSRPTPDGRFAGHFLEYPSWPASLYCEAVSRVAGRLLHYMRDEEVRFTVARLDIDALRLMSASESVTFHVRCTSASKLLSRYVFCATIQRDDVVASEIELEVYV